MDTQKYTVLFVCAHNSVRSILAESLLNEMGGPHFKAYSAGSDPTGQVHPFALELLAEHGLPTAGLRSKSWDEFAGLNAPTLDFVITVCDKVSGERRPLWPGHTITADWHIEAPRVCGQTDESARIAIAHVFRLLTQRINAFLSLPLSHYDHLSLHPHADARAHDAN